MAGQSWDRVPIDAQSVEAPLSYAAIFLVAQVRVDAASLTTVKDALGGSRIW